MTAHDVMVGYQPRPHREQRIVASRWLTRRRPRRVSAELAREQWGGMRISEHGVWRVLAAFLGERQPARLRRRIDLDVQLPRIAWGHELLTRRMRVRARPRSSAAVLDSTQAGC